QKAAVESQQLRYVDYRIARQTGRTCWQQDVSGSFGEFEVGRDHRDYCGLNAAEIEGVGLNHKYRPPVARFRTTRLGKIRPPNLSSLNSVHRYQPSFSRDFIWARCNPESSLAGEREYTSFRRSVIALPCCRCKYSASALAYS